MAEQPVNILIVDDRQENLVALRAVLESEDYQVISATSGEEALKWLLRMDFAAILLDVQMPGMDGFETAKVIHEREKSRHIPIIFLTALSQPGPYQMKGYSMGAIDYLVKPFPPEILRNKVKRFVELHSKQQQIVYQRNLLAQRTQELEKAYHDLKQSRTISQLIQDSTTDVLITMDYRGCILTANQAVRGMFGYEEEQLQGRFMTDLIPRLDVSSLELQENGQVLELIAVRRDKMEFPVDVVASRAELDSGMLIVCSIRDATERRRQYQLLELLVQERSSELVMANKQLQEELSNRAEMLVRIEESEAQYKSLFEYHPDAIFVRRQNSDIIWFVNETGVELLGTNSKEEVIGHSMFEFIHPEDGAAAGKSAVYYEPRWEIREAVPVRLLRKSGEAVDVEVKMIPFHYRGEAAVHVVARDVSELKLSREFILKSEQRRVVGELATGIAHEIRNPLTSLRGFIQLLTEELPVTRAQYGQIMIDEIDRINAIVSELLLLGRANRAAFKPFALDAAVRSVMTLMTAEANLHNVSFLQKLASGVLVVGEEAKLKQVMVNIMKNAIEAMPDGGQLEIRLEPSQTGMVSLIITDEGQGIHPDILTEIERPFFSTKENGTGLGLAICRNIVQEHHGNLFIHSESGQGTAVEVQLPVRQRLAADSSKSST